MKSFIYSWCCHEICKVAFFVDCQQTYNLFIYVCMYLFIYFTFKCLRCLVGPDSAHFWDSFLWVLKHQAHLLKQSVFKKKATPVLSCSVRRYRHAFLRGNETVSVFHGLSWLKCAGFAGVVKGNAASSHPPQSKRSIFTCTLKNRVLRTP